MNLGLLFLQAELATLTLYDSPKWKYHTGNIQNKDVTKKAWSKYGFLLMLLIRAIKFQSRKFPFEWLMLFSTGLYVPMAQQP